MVFLIDSRITPESIGAVNAAGGSMTGPLEFVQDNVRLANLFAIAGWAVAMENYNGGDKASLVISAANAKAQFGINGAFYDVLHTGNMSEQGIPKITVISNVSLTFTNKMAVIYNSALTTESVCFVQERVAGGAYFNCVSGVVPQNGWATISHYNNGSNGTNFDIIIINP